MIYIKGILIVKCTVPCDQIIGDLKSFKTLENDSHKDIYYIQLKSEYYLSF